jgi:hypothetical protein
MKSMGRGRGLRHNKGVRRTGMRLQFAAKLMAWWEESQ